MSMDLRDLIDQLTDLADEYGDDTEVRLAHQPQWAFEYAIDNVVGVMLPAEGARKHKQPMVYIGEGSQIGYLPSKASIALDWSEARDDDEDEDDEDNEKCPGCGCIPGDGPTPGCEHPDGCGVR